MLVILAAFFWGSRGDAPRASRGSAALTGDLLWAARGRASAEACGPGSTKLCDTWDFERAPHVDELCACCRRGTLRGRVPALRGE